MKIKPSVLGFYVRHYLYATLFSLILVVAGIYMFTLIREITISVAMIGLAILIVAIGIIHSKVHAGSTYLEIDDKQLIFDTGILSHYRTIAPLAKITDSAMKRTFFERMIGVADLTVNTSGDSEPEITANDFEYAEVSKMHELVNHRLHITPDTQEKEKQKR